MSFLTKTHLRRRAGLLAIDKGSETAGQVNSVSACSAILILFVIVTALYASGYPFFALWVSAASVAALFFYGANKASEPEG
ncbi:MAG TPA: hypothetical protein VEK14_06110 [Rhodomicrobium sp.]|nr:hypothetical protein [Rhodomicrobium sp.]